MSAVAAEPNDGAFKSNHHNMSGSELKVLSDAWGLNPEKTLKTNNKDADTTVAKKPTADFFIIFHEYSPPGIF